MPTSDTGKDKEKEGKKDQAASSDWNGQQEWEMHEWGSSGANNWGNVVPNNSGGNWGNVVPNTNSSSSGNWQQGNWEQGNAQGGNWQQGNSSQGESQPTWH
jgi:hypothetical protein